MESHRLTGFKPRKNTSLLFHRMTLRPCLLNEDKFNSVLREQMSTEPLSGVRTGFSERVVVLLCLAPWTGLGHPMFSGVEGECMRPAFWKTSCDSRKGLTCLVGVQKPFSPPGPQCQCQLNLSIGHRKLDLGKHPFVFFADLQ